MKTRKVLCLVGAVSVLTFLMTGCAMFKQNRLDDVKQFAPLPAGTVKPTATYSLHSINQLGWRRIEVTGAYLELLKKEFGEVCQESGYFASISEGEGGTLQMQLNLNRSGDSFGALFAAGITGASLYTIPSWCTFDFDLTVKVTKDNKEYSYSLNDACKLVQWLPMMFAFPFHPLTVDVEVRKNIYKHLLLRMQQDGVLPKPASLGDRSSIILKIEGTPTA